MLLLSSIYIVLVRERERDFRSRILVYFWQERRFFVVFKKVCESCKFYSFSGQKLRKFLFPLQYSRCLLAAYISQFIWIHFRFHRISIARETYPKRVILTKSLIVGSTLWIHSCLSARWKKLSISCYSRFEKTIMSTFASLYIFHIYVYTYLYGK